MADDDVQRGTAKRQIARLLGGSVTPIFVLSEEDQIVFANEALGEWLGISADSLIGSDCSHALPTVTTFQGRLASWLGLPPNINRHLAGMYPMAPFPSEHIADGSESDEAERLRRAAECWLRIVVPIELGPKPTVMCLLKSDSGDLNQIFDSLACSALQGSLLQSALPRAIAQDLWFMLGDGPESTRTLNQFHAAIAGNRDVHVLGPSNGPLLEIANAIAQQRSLPSKTGNKSRSPSIIVECHLMDHDLLRSMFELIDDQCRAARSTGNVPHIVLHRLDQLPGDLIPGLCSQALGKWRMIATSSTLDLLQLSPANPLWGKLVAQLDSHTVSVAGLNHRLADIELLIAGWLDLHAKQAQEASKFRWSGSFMDAMLAYPWPGDCGEFAATMASAVASCSDRYLTDRDLPIAIRTFPSHVQRSDSEGNIDLDDVLETVERDLIVRAIARFPKNRAAAAKLLGISRSRLLRRLQQWGLEPAEAAPLAADDAPVFEEVDDVESKG